MCNSCFKRMKMMWYFGIKKNCFSFSASSTLFCFFCIYFWNELNYWHNETILFSLSLLCQHTQSLKLNIYIQYFIIKLQFNFWISSCCYTIHITNLLNYCSVYYNKKFFFANSLHLFMENARVTWNNLNQWSILCLLMYLLINLICCISAWKIWWCNFRSLKSHRIDYYRNHIKY